MLQLRNYVYKATLRMIHLRLIQSHLIYCISSLGSASQKALHPAEVLQKRVIRLMTFNNSEAHTHPLFKSLKIMKLKDLLSMKLLSSCTISAIIRLRPQLARIL